MLRTSCDLPRAIWPPQHRRPAPYTQIREVRVAIAKVSEIIASSTKSFDDAIQNGLKRANKTLRGVSGAWVKSMRVELKNGKIQEYRVSLKVTFVLSD
ncbi:MAG: hypothetical protein MNPFHGCM_03193 [Gemmatimonadaceae bacterium]|nr:hypothetical protein [Gemmatimonadaceae bacterium]